VDHGKLATDSSGALLPGKNRVVQPMPVWPVLGKKAQMPESHQAHFQGQTTVRYDLGRRELGGVRPRTTTRTLPVIAGYRHAPIPPICCLESRLPPPANPGVCGETSPAPCAAPRAACNADSRHKYAFETSQFQP